jgi:glycosyltransferase involved in cell wall biosynthesis
VFVYLSEHEGFGVPILEAWHHDVPVVGFDAGAIAEVAGDAALILSDKSAPAVAAAVQRVQTDTDLRDRLIARSRQRRQVFSLEQAQARFLDAVARVRPRS